MHLRPYQLKALNQIRDEYKRGTKKVLLHLATGAGKTVIFCEILKGIHAKKKKALMVVRGRKLVDQASQRLIREKVEHGVLMANHWNYRPYHNIQVCSIDTLRARNLRPEADLIVIDEAHLATSQTYHDFLKDYNCFLLPVTATPYNDEPLSHIAEKIIKPISIKDLIEDGYLVPPRYFVPFIPKLDGIQISSSTKDYVQDQLSDFMSQNKLVGDLVDNWKKFGQNRPTLCFAVSIVHSKAIVDQFNRNGIPAEHHDADSTDQERNDAIEKLKRGAIRIISNVGIFCTGVDIPFLSCIVLARPTRSEILYIQQAGRGTRPCDGKSNFIMLDHAGNILRHGFIEKEPEGVLDGKPKRKSGVSGPKVCPKCFLAFLGCFCPECGEIQHKPREFLNIDGELQEVTNEPFEARVNRFIREHKKIAHDRGYKSGWVFYRLKDAFGDDIANKFMPRREVPEWIKHKLMLEGKWRNLPKSS